MQKGISKTELIYYLEEMIKMNLSTEFEEDIYYSIKYTGKANKKKLKNVISRMNQ